MSDRLVQLGHSGGLSGEPCVHTHPFCYQSTKAKGYKEQGADVLLYRPKRRARLSVFG